MFLLTGAFFEKNISAIKKTINERIVESQFMEIAQIISGGSKTEVVEYALARTNSPAAIAEYTLKLPDKKLLQTKLHEFFDSTVREMEGTYGTEY